MSKHDDDLQHILFGEVKDMEMSVLVIKNYFFLQKIDDVIDFFQKNIRKFILMNISFSFT